MFLIGTVLVIQMAAAQAQPRDARLAPTSGTGVIRGIVVDARTDAPIAGATVSVAQPGDAGIGGTAYTAETVAADDGRFELTGLPAGPLFVAVSPAAHTATHLGRVLGKERGFGMSGRPALELAPGEVRTGLRIPLERTFAIEGRVIDEFGAPIAEATITARTKEGSLGNPERHTDDRGTFRLFRLPAGSYEVCATASGGWNRRFGPPAEGDGLTSGYDRTCVPQLVTVGDERTPRVEIQMQRVGTYTLSGSILSGTGADVSKADVRVVRISPEHTGNGGTTQVQDGRFAVRGLLPGEYLVMAGIRERDTYPSNLTEAASLSIRIDSTDVSGITLATTPVATVLARVERDPRATAPLPARAMPRLVPPFSRLSIPFFTRPPETVRNDDGTFTIDGIHGPYVIGMPELPPGWFVASVRHGNEDITGRPREFRAGDDRPVVIVVSNRAATLRARLLEQDGKPPEDAYVLLVPADPVRWNAMPLASAPVQDAEGFFTLKAAPGRYFATAVTLSDFRRFAGLGSLEPIVRAGQPVTLVEGETVTTDVPVKSLAQIR